MTINGLEQLSAQRAKRTRSARSVPPPQHAPKPPVAAAPATPVTEPAPAAQPKHQRPAAAAPTPKTDDELKRVTVYLAEDSTDFIDAVLLASKHMKPRVNSASAVIRLALSRLNEQLTPQETAVLLRDRALTATPNNQGGRKRV